VRDATRVDDALRGVTSLAGELEQEIAQLEQQLRIKRGELDRLRACARVFAGVDAEAEVAR
jgi:hypothetical protein